MKQLFGLKLGGLDRLDFFLFQLLENGNLIDEAHRCREVGVAYITFSRLNDTEACLVDGKAGGVGLYFRHLVDDTSLSACHSLNDRNQIVFVSTVGGVQMRKCVVFKIGIVAFVDMSMGSYLQRDPTAQHGIEQTIHSNSIAVALSVFGAAVERVVREGNDESFGGYCLLELTFQGVKGGDRLKSAVNQSERIVGKEIEGTDGQAGCQSCIESIQFKALRKKFFGVICHVLMITRDVHYWSFLRYLLEQQKKLNIVGTLIRIQIICNVSINNDSRYVFLSDDFLQISGNGDQRFGQDGSPIRQNCNVDFLVFGDGICNFNFYPILLKGSRFHSLTFFPAKNRIGEGFSKNDPCERALLNVSDISSHVLRGSDGLGLALYAIVAPRSDGSNVRFGAL